MNPTKVLKLVDDYATLAAQAKVLNELVDAAKSKILALGDGSYNGTAHKVVVSTSIPVRFDSAAFKEAHPSLYESFKAQGNAVTSARIHGR
jgi:2-phospho-L-lactate guanylyltransferase (CobY/MobA/RfbA family)